MDPARRAFYAYHASLMEPWDGPASVCFSDGTVVGAVLDRNGLRPSRIWVTEDGLVVMASEVGVPRSRPGEGGQADAPAAGRMFLVDTAQGRIVSDEEIKSELAAEHPYREWLDSQQFHLDELPQGPYIRMPHHRVVLRQQAFGYTYEDSTCWSRRWRAPGPSRSARWVPTPRSPCSRPGRGCCSTTSSSCSPR